jgi:NAD(P)-dependent dehydrogenase (short-subunit alcohol dehydrogenase family)
MPSLNDRVVLLTGGATGIGRAIALDMAAAGATVAIGDTNVDGGRRTAEELLSAGGLRATRRAGQRRRHLRRVVSPP